MLESCGETANVSPLKAEEPEEVRGIDKDLPRFAEAGLAAELAPVVCSLGKVAGGDVVPDLVPLGRRQYPPQGLVRPREAVEICGPVLVDPTRPDWLHVAFLARLSPIAIRKATARAIIVGDM